SPDETPAHLLAALEHFSTEEWIANRTCELKPSSNVRFRARDGRLRHRAFIDFQPFELRRLLSPQRSVFCGSHAQRIKLRARSRKVRCLAEMSQLDQTIAFLSHGVCQLRRDLGYQRRLLIVLHEIVGRKRRANASHGVDKTITNLRMLGRKRSHRWREGHT